jgi:integrase
MPRTRLTAAFARTCPPPADGAARIDHFDTAVPGLVLEVRRSGGRTFHFRYRDESGRLRQQKIADARDLSLDRARQAARALRAGLALGVDPRAEAERARAIPTFGAFVAERYMPYVKVRKRSWATDECLLRLHLLPRWERMRMDMISQADVIAMHQASLTGGAAPATANRHLILAKFVFNCAIRWKLLPPGSNPAVGVPPFAENNRRERYLSAAEVQRLYRELALMENRTLAGLIEFLLVTGARRGEAVNARWEHVDTERRAWLVPLSKSGRPRHIPLSDAALAVLARVPRTPGVPWVFANPDTGRPYRAIHDHWDNVRHRAGLPDLRMHDLRHSFASFLVNNGRTLYEVQALLGHSDAKTTMRYAHLSQTALLDAANAAGSVIRDAADGKGEAS